MTKIEKEIEEITKRLSVLQEKLKLERSQKKFLCICGKKHRICDCDAIQTTYWSNEPYNEEWRDGDIHIICPVSKVENRIYFPDDPIPIKDKFYQSWNGQFKTIYFSLFKSVLRKSVPITSIMQNNTYFNDNKEKFGIK